MEGKRIMGEARIPGFIDEFLLMKQILVHISAWSVLFTEMTTRNYKR